MLFDPSSRICVCEVPFDNSYKNVVYFSTALEQTQYFSKRVVKIFTDYLIVREALPDGGVRSSIKVGENIATLRSLRANYVYWTNSNHSDKVFYAFITDMIYINEKTTRLVIETDVYQTWRFEANLLDSFVVREHSEIDDIGYNLVPEKFNIEDYEYVELNTDNDLALLKNWGYLVASTEPQGESLTQIYPTGTHSGIYQGLHFYYIESPDALDTFLKSAMEEDNECIQSVTLIPKFCMGLARMADNGWIEHTTAVASRTFHVDVPYAYDGYVPRNNKLFTSPFFKMMVTNNAGTEAEYALEDFKKVDGEYYPQFTMTGDISINPSVMLTPVNYRKAEMCPDFGMMLGGFPQCAFNSDTFKLWLSKNWGNLRAQEIGNAASTTAGLAMAGASWMMGNPYMAIAMGIGAVASGISNIASEMGTISAASKEPNKMHAGAVSNNLLTAMEMNRFTFYAQRIKAHMAQRLDDFFTMFGYQTNKLKKPNVSSRPYFNYVQTIDVNITGGIPQDDMEKLKSIYNNGVTLWKPNATIGNYAVDNSAGGN